MVSGAVKPDDERESVLFVRMRPGVPTCNARRGAAIRCDAKSVAILVLYGDCAPLTLGVVGSGAPRYPPCGSCQC